MKITWIRIYSGHGERSIAKFTRGSDERAYPITAPSSSRLNEILYEDWIEYVGSFVTTYSLDIFHHTNYGMKKESEEYEPPF